jgi:hypothetical protein
MNQTASKTEKKVISIGKVWKKKTLLWCVVMFSQLIRHEKDASDCNSITTQHSILYIIDTQVNLANKKK